MTNTDPVDLNSILPHGETLMPLLLSSFLTQNDLYQLLKSRGIFLSSNEKEQTVPILKNLILTPLEFDFLRDRQKVKEDRVKVTTTHFEIESDNSLVELTREETIPINSLVVGLPINYQIEGAPSLRVISHNHVCYEYSIVRNDVSKDWANSKSRHEGRVDVEKTGNSITFTTEHTSEETKELGKLVQKRAISSIRNASKSQTETKPWKIKFDSFDNIGRVKFLFGVVESGFSYTEDELVDVSFGPDPRKQLDGNAAWMKDKVDSLRLKGKKLGDIEYFSNTKYSETMLVEALEAVVDFTINEKNYSASVRLGFEGYLKSRIIDTEFEQSIISLNDDKGVPIRSKEIARELQRRIDIEVQKKYVEFKLSESS